MDQSHITRHCARNLERTSHARLHFATSAKRRMRGRTDCDMCCGMTYRQFHRTTTAVYRIGLQHTRKELLGNCIYKKKKNFVSPMQDVVMQPSEVSRRYFDAGSPKKKIRIPSMATRSTSRCSTRQSSFLLWYSRAIGRKPTREHATSRIAPAALLARHAPSLHERPPAHVNFNIHNRHRGRVGHLSVHSNETEHTAGSTGPETRDDSSRDCGSNTRRAAHEVSVVIGEVPPGLWWSGDALGLTVSPHVKSHILLVRMARGNETDGNLNCRYAQAHIQRGKW